MSAALAEQKAPSELVVFKDQLDQREEQFKAALPAHIPVERFMRVVLTAVQNNPDLLGASRQSFFNSCMRSAQDGLLPDGREGAIVIFNTKEKRDGRDVWIRKAQWMPMVFGILKKIRNSGEVATITARVVYGGDAFRYWIDDTGEHLTYEPSDNPDRSVVRRVFAMAKTKDGELFVEPLTPEDIEKIRNVSRSKDKGPWVDWWEEMAKKSAIRRLAKRLPMSTDLDDLIRRDDDLYDMAGAREAGRDEARRPRLVQALDALASRPIVEHEASAAQQDEADDSNQQSASPPVLPGEAEDGAGAPTNTESDSGAPATDPEDEDIDPTSPDYRRGFEDRKKGVKRCLSAEIKGDPVRLAHWQAGRDAGAPDAEG